MLKVKTDDKLYIFEVILMFFICATIIVQRAGITSMLFKLTFIVLLLGILIQLVNRPTLNKLHILAIFIVILSFFNVFLQTYNWSFAYANKLIIFWCSVLMIPFLSSMEINRTHVNWILGINLCIALVYPVMYYRLQNPGYLNEWLTFHFTNPNLTGMFLMHSALYCFISIYYFKNFIVRIGIFILLSFIVYFDFATGARSTLVVFIFFALFIFLNFALKNGITISPKISMIIILMPLVLALVYLELHEIGLIDKLFSFFDFGEGKSLNSRVYIWTAGLSGFKKNPILGDYYGISNGLGMSQMHNTHIDILASYGVLPFVLFIILLHNGIKEVIPSANTKFSRIALFAFYAVILEGTFEAALVSGGVGLYIMSFGFLLLAKYTSEEEDIDIQNMKREARRLAKMGRRI